MMFQNDDFDKKYLNSDDQILDTKHYKRKYKRNEHSEEYEIRQTKIKQTKIRNPILEGSLNVLLTIADIILDFI